MNYERILVVEGDPEVSDLIARQALKPLGFQVRVIRDAPRALQEALNFAPDIIIVNLNLPGLSGKDLLVALSSQGMSIPVIVVADQGMESDVIQAFRLGASDYLRWPIRETEVVSAVERALIQVRTSRDRENLSRKVEKTNRELQSRVRELTTILGIGKAVTSITDRRTLFDKIIEGAVFVSEADKGWLLLREGDERTFKLSAFRNLPKSIVSKIDRPWDDGISKLVAISGESLSIHGPPLKRLKVSRLGNSALVVPVKVKKEVVGLMAVVREASKPFSPSNRTLLEALADYASISLVNVKLFQAVEERARSLMEIAENARESEKVKAEVLGKIGGELDSALPLITHEINSLSQKENPSLSDGQKGSIRLINEQLDRAKVAVNGLEFIQKVYTPRNLVVVNFVDLAKASVARLQKLAEDNSVSLVTHLPPTPLFVSVDVDQIRQVFDVILSNALRASRKGSVTVIIKQNEAGVSQISIEDTGPGMSEENLENVFNPLFEREPASPDDLDRLGVELALAKEIVKAHGGKLWVESQLGEGSMFHFNLKPARN
jgi:signal transduction histidine kinase/DNA-binding response OmpR family regulator